MRLKCRARSVSSSRPSSGNRRPYSPVAMARLPSRSSATERTTRRAETSAVSAEASRASGSEASSAALRVRRTPRSKSGRRLAPAGPIKVIIC